MNTIIPAGVYRDADAAIEFLQNAFGFELVNAFRDESGVPQHVEMRHGVGWIMFGQAREGAEQPPVGGAGIYVTVDDPDAHCEQARSAGATITREPNSPDYGGREYSCIDPEGNRWSFGTYQPGAE